MSRSLVIACALKHDDRDMPRRRVALQLARGIPAVEHRKPEIHEDEIGRRIARERNGLKSVAGQQHAIAAPLEAARQRIAARFVVFDQQ